MAMSRGFLEKKFERPRLESVGQSRKTKWGSPMCPGFDGMHFLSSWFNGRWAPSMTYHIFNLRSRSFNIWCWNCIRALSRCWWKPPLPVPYFNFEPQFMQSTVGTDSRDQRPKTFLHPHSFIFKASSGVINIACIVAMSREGWTWSKPGMEIMWSWQGLWRQIPAATVLFKAWCGVSLDTNLRIFSGILFSPPMMSFLVL